MVKILRITALLTTFVAVSTARADDTIFKDNDRIAFIGNTFVERAQTFGHIETNILIASKAKHLVFRNLGWSGDSVFNDSRSYFGPPKEGRDRLAKAVGEMQPNVILICYGTGAAMSINQPWTNEKSELTAVVGAGLESELEVFLNGYRQLIENVRNAAGDSLREIVLITPPPLENLGPPLPDQIENNQNIAAFSKAIVELAAKEKIKSIDLFKAVGHSADVADPPLTENGLHYGDAGYQMIANHILTGLGLGPEVISKTDFSQFTRIRNAVVEKNRLFFHRWRPANETYLFLFRKHEQGNNAKEIPMFDPLIKKKEALIDNIRTAIQNPSKPA